MDVIGDGIGGSKDGKRLGLVATRRSDNIDHSDMVVYGLHLAGEIRRGRDRMPGRVDEGRGPRPSGE